VDLIAALREAEPRLVRYEGGWILEGEAEPVAYLDLTGARDDVNWSEQLESLHADATQTHFIDRLTRHAVVSFVRSAGTVADVISDVGCSSGYLLEELRVAFPMAELLGIDLVRDGLINAHGLVPDARLLRADAGALPLPDAALDVVTCANVLEHVDDDVGVLRELRRVLRPQGAAVLVVPRGPELFDYFDEHLGHTRRYACGELAAKARRAGFDLLRSTALGGVVYPAFWAQKKINRRRGAALTPAQRAERVERAVRSTRDSRIGRVTAAVERELLDRGVHFKNGIREVSVVASGSRS
jgi:SAM-dependent methyltransferase